MLTHEFGMTFCNFKNGNQINTLELSLVVSPLCVCACAHARTWANMCGGMCKHVCIIMDLTHLLFLRVSPINISAQKLGFFFILMEDTL